MYVQDGVYNHLIEKLSQSVSELIVGDELQSDFAIGPLAPLFRFSNKSDVIKQANDTEFVLATYFYTRYLSRALRVGEALEYSIVGINTGIISSEVAPFGEIKASGLGREGSKYGIENCLKIKYMWISL